MTRFKASSLAYAIIFLLFIGLFASGILLLSGSHKIIEVNARIKENVLTNTHNNLNWFLQTELSGEKINITGDTSFLSTNHWGAWNVVHSKTYHGRFNFERFALIGEKFNKEKPALYLADTDQKLSLAGATRIEGKVYLPKRGVERAYIGGKNYTGEKLIYGNQSIAEKKLPTIKHSAQVFDLVEFLKKEDVIEISQINSSIKQKFSDPILFLQSITPVFLEDSIQGRVVIQSFDSIFVSSKSNLQNVILIAPIIRIEKGFKGSVQIEASQRVTIEEDVALKYPSTIRLIEKQKNSTREKHGVYFGENSELLGGILILSNKPNFRNLIQLSLSETSLVAGLVYNQGESDVKGSIIGSLYTYKINLKTRSSSYSNHLLDALISSKKLPDYFIYPNWLESEILGETEIIDWL